jgi:hypothetical protein
MLENEGWFLNVSARPQCPVEPARAEVIFELEPFSGQEGELSRLLLIPGRLTATVVSGPILGWSLKANHRAQPAQRRRNGLHPLH